MTSPVEVNSWLIGQREVFEALADYLNNPIGLQPAWEEEQRIKKNKEGESSYV